MLEYEVHRPAESLPSPPTIIFLHGYGADEFDLLPFAEVFDPRFLTISIRAPFSLPQGGNAWYKLAMTSVGFTPDDPTRYESERMLLHDIPLIVEAELGTPENITLLGFSQGAAMCYSLLAKHDLGKIGLGIRALVALSGYIPDDSKAPLSTRELSKLPVFIGHGSLDELIPVEASEVAAGILMATQALVSRHTYPIGHGVAQEELRDIRLWLEEKLENV